MSIIIDEYLVVDSEDGFVPEPWLRIPIERFFLREMIKSKNGEYTFQIKDFKIPLSLWKNYKVHKGHIWPKIKDCFNLKYKTDRIFIIHKIPNPFIYIDIPRTASTSIRQFLGYSSGHYTLDNICQGGSDGSGNAYNSAVHSKLPVVFFTRNPFDRQVSAYEYVQQKEKKYKDFDDFVSAGYDQLKTKNIEPVNLLMYLPQTVFIISPEHHGPLTALRFEKLEEHFDLLCRYMLGHVKKYKLPHLNKRLKEKIPYQEYYKNIETYEKTCEMYMSDFKNFNYSTNL